MIHQPLSVLPDNSKLQDRMAKQNSLLSEVLHPCFADWETEAQTNYVICPG